MISGTFVYESSFRLECGVSLPLLEIAYTHHGKSINSGAPIVWICHALTASSDPGDWWTDFVGPERIFDTNHYCILCANILGSCYGSTGPESINPVTQEPYRSTFPLVTIRDMVRAHILLRRHLNIEQIDYLVGGSMGGYQCLEWAQAEPKCIKRLFLLATSAEETAWGIAIHTAQRLAIEADPAFEQNKPGGGQAGLAAARAMGMITYRTYDALVRQQADPDPDKLGDYRAESYIRYQGRKLVQRFSAYAYYALTKSMDSHRLHRGYNTSIESRLASLTQPSLIIGISTDVLCPPSEQQKMANAMPNATLHIIESEFGHDGFLVEHQQIGKVFLDWVSTQVLKS